MKWLVMIMMLVSLFGLGFLSHLLIVVKSNEQTIQQSQSEPLTAGFRTYTLAPCDNGYEVQDLKGYSIINWKEIREHLRKQDLIPGSMTPTKYDPDTGQVTEAWIEILGKAPGEVPRQETLKL